MCRPTIIYFAPGSYFGPFITLSCYGRDADITSQHVSINFGTVPFMTCDQSNASFLPLLPPQVLKFTLDVTEHLKYGNHSTFAFAITKNLLRPLK